MIQPFKSFYITPFCHELGNRVMASNFWEKILKRRGQVRQTMIFTTTVGFEVVLDSQQLPPQPPTVDSLLLVSVACLDLTFILCGV